MTSDQLLSPRFNIPVVLLIVYLTVSACAHIAPASDRDNNRAEYVQAAEELRKSAEAGDGSAQNTLGLLYYEGKGVLQSYRQAKEWFEKAAKQGRARAQVNLGTLYLRGEGAPQSDEMALFWFNQAAEQGDALALAKLMSVRGHGVSQDLMAMAEEPWGLPESTTVASKPPEPLKKVNASREPAIVASKSPEPVKARRTSAEPTTVASKLSEPVKALSTSHERAEELSTFPGEGSSTANYLRKLAEAEDRDAQNRLGLLYYEGMGVPQNFEQASLWFRKAAQQGHAGAQVNLGTLYFLGYGASESDQEALFWFRNAAEQGDALAFAKLGRMYELGRGVSQDLIQAHMWYNRSAAHGEKRAAEIRDALAKQMTPAQIAAAQRLAVEWKSNNRPGIIPTTAGGYP